VILTLQKHLQVSDHYSGLSFLETRDLGATWRGPVAPEELDWVKESEKVTLAVADVTPGWHARTGKLIAIGARVRYGTGGEQLEDRPRSNQTAYSVLDPATGAWSRWRLLELPDREEFNFARNACSQWIVKPDGGILLPIYHGRKDSEPFSVTVAACTFDGEKLSFASQGNTLKLDEDRGLCEPSLAAFGGRYYLTLRSDRRGYVTASDDGLRYDPSSPGPSTTAPSSGATTRSSTGSLARARSTSSTPERRGQRCHRAASGSPLHGADRSRQASRHP